METKRKLIRQFILILIVGLAVSFFSGEHEWSYTIQPDWDQDLEIILTNLNLILPFVVLALGLGVYIYLRIWNSQQPEDYSEPGERQEDSQLE